jgi:hypothetical protein
MKLIYRNIIAHKQQYVFSILLLLFYNSIFVFSQEVLVSGEASVLINDPLKTRLQYENEALNLARDNAVDKAFGTSVMSNYERLTVTEMQGRSVAFNSDIRGNFISTFPNGTWNKDVTKICVEEKDANGNYWLKCRVTGYAGKIESAKVQFIAYTLDGLNPRLNKSEMFINRESGYLYFRSPEKGYIVAFYDDLKTVQLCIPYNAIEENYLKIDGNREYIFFSPEKSDYLSDKKQVDEIEFYTEMPVDYNQFYILFSPTPPGVYFYNPAEKLEDGYTTFKSMERKDFNSWLQENRTRNKDLQVQIIGVTIKGTP